MNILVIVAHLDDETFGMGGTLMELAKTNNVKVISVCKGRNSEDSVSRIKTFKELSKKYNYKTKIFDYWDLQLYKVSPAVLANEIVDEIKKFQPEVIYTVAEDLHTEHKLINTCVKVAIRNSSIKRFFEIFIPGSSNINSFTINKVIEIDLKQKLENCSMYQTEIRANTLKLMEHFHKFIGLNFGCRNAEAFNLVFDKEYCD